MGFDQLETFPKSIYDYLKMQVRTTDPLIDCYVRATFNPGGIGHSWVKKHFIDTCDFNGKVRFFVERDGESIRCKKDEPGALSRAFVFSTVHDNKHIMENDPNYIIRLRSLPENLRKAMEEGDWDAFEGQYFGEFSRSIHVLPYIFYKDMCEHVEPVRFISMDYGFAKQSAVLWHAIFPEKMVTYREFYKPGYDYKALAKMIIQMTPKEEKIAYLTYDPAIQGDKAHHQSEPKENTMKGKSGADILRQEIGDRFGCLAGDNRRVVGWTRMHEYLKPYEDQHGKTTAYWLMTDNCQNLIRTLPVLVHDDTNPEDVNTECEDHAPDAARYGIMSRPNIPKNPTEPPTKAGKFWKKVQRDIKKKKIKSSIQNLEEDDMVDIIEGGEFI